MKSKTKPTPRPKPKASRKSRFKPKTGYLVLRVQDWADLTFAGHPLPKPKGSGDGFIQLYYDRAQAEIQAEGRYPIQEILTQPPPKPPKRSSK